MPNLSNSPLIDHSSSSASLREAAAAAGVFPPFSVRDFLDHVETREFTASITSDGLEALRGDVRITIRSNGDFSITYSMHDSGVPNYQVHLVVLLQGSQGDDSILAGEDSVAVLFETAGDVEGTASLKLSARRDFSSTDSGNNALIQRHWTQ